MLWLVRLKDELDEKIAEFAILVRSHLKGHGLGWLLMWPVIDYAKEKHLRRVYGDVLVENATMLANVHRIRFPNAGYGTGDHTRRPRCGKHRGLVSSQIPVAKRAGLCQNSHQTTRRNGASGIARRRMRRRASM